MQRTHKIALVVNNTQKTYLSRCAGTARFSYNWALSRSQEHYAAFTEDPTLPRPNQFSLRRELNAIKREEFPWMLEVTKCAPQEAIRDLGRAFENFFSGRAKYPTFKKKGLHDSFRVSSGFFKIEGKKIRLPHIGWIRMRECLRYPEAKVVSVTISRKANRWYASVVCEVLDTGRCAQVGAASSTIGIAVGVSEYVCSDGCRHRLPRAYRRKERSLRRAQQTLSRRQRGSANYKKQRCKVAKIHAGIADIRGDWLHKLTSGIAVYNAVIVIEDLNVKGMVQNHHLAKSITDAAFGEFRRQLNYKTEELGHVLLVADRFYPSSKLCSVCGTKTKHLPLSMRHWICPACSSVHDRDLNAAYNLKAYAASSAVSACGEFLTAGIVLPYGVQSQVASVKQEQSVKPCVSKFE